MMSGDNKRDREGEKINLLCTPEEEQLPARCGRSDGEEIPKEVVYIKKSR